MGESTNKENSNTATTTTTVDETTTTTTTAEVVPENQGSPKNEGSKSSSKTTSTTTIDASSAGHVPGESQGEVAVDKEAKAVTTNDNTQTAEQRGDEARAEAVRNHNAEHANDDDENRSVPTEV